MSPTEINRAAPLAEELFDRVIHKVAEARRAAGHQSYFPLAATRGARTYFEPAGVRVMEKSDFEFPGGGTSAGLIDALKAYWIERGDHDLAAMAPLLHELAEAVIAEFEEGDGSVDILCYTMF